jgi:hypothetical protein
MYLYFEYRYAECRYSECLYAECRYYERLYAECHGTFLGQVFSLLHGRIFCSKLQDYFLYKNTAPF